MPRPALSASRSAELLALLAAHPDESFSLSELSRRLGINLASTHAVLHALAQAGYVHRDDGDLSWSLGPVLVVVGEAAARRHPAVPRARAALAAVAARHGLGGLLTAHVGGDLLVLQAVGGDHARARTTIGQRVPAVPPIAAIHVAFAAEDVRRAWLAAAPGPLRPGYARLLDEVQAAGWAARHDQRPQPHLRRSLRRLQDAPHAAAVRADLDAAVADLAEPTAVSTTLGDDDHDGRGRDLASLAALARPPGSAPVGLYLVDFPPGLTPAAARAARDDLLAAAAAVSAPADGRPTARDDGPDTRAAEAVL